MVGTRKRDLSLFVAVAISAAVHLAVLLGPAWRLPADDATVLPPLSARLTPLPRPTVVQPDEKRVVLGDAPPPRPRPKPRRPVRPAEPAVASAPMSASDSSSPVRSPVRRAATRAASSTSS